MSPLEPSSSRSRELPSLLLTFLAGKYLHDSNVQLSYAITAVPLLLFWFTTRAFTNPEKCAAIAYNVTMLTWLYKTQKMFEQEDGTSQQRWFSHSLLMMVIHLMGLMLGHELLHQRISRVWPCMVFGHNGYLVYVWEHIFHHKHAGTEEDYSSSTQGTSIYSFLLSRYPIHLRSSFKFFPQAFFATTTAWIMYITCISLLFSRQTAVFMLYQTFVHWFWVDAFTYTSHYGVISLNSQTSIAWDSEMWWFLVPFFYGIEKHTEHHYAPSRMAKDLQHRGYLKYPVTLETALATAFVPKKWFAMTDPILDRARKGEGLKN
mmetsp:Transcript_16901/g.22116  ORF Transcript_16901/g.22116 Transcript_16901/m.22116 type:complete len:318 (+) Transcript_16901:200-1153(+)